MKTSIQLPVLVSFVTVAMLSSMNAQSQKDATILYNSQPVEVQLSEAGRILAFYGLSPNYMAGYDLGPSKATQQSITDIQLVEPGFTNSSQNAEYDVVSRDRVDLSFNDGFATLSQSTIGQLNEVSKKVLAEGYAKVLVTAYSSAEKSEKLLQNRLNSVITYLNIKGLSSDQVVTEVRESAALTDTVSINYIQ